jgi:hypothetical protein
MATPASTSPYRYRPDPIHIVAALSLVIGIAAAVRLDFSGRTELASTAAACIAAGMAAAVRSRSWNKAFGAIAVAAAAGIGLAQRSLDIQDVALDSLAYFLIIAGIVCWADDRSSLASCVVLPAAGVALVLPFLGRGTNTESPGATIEVLAAIAACLAIGTGHRDRCIDFDRPIMDGSYRFRRSLRDAPRFHGPFRNSEASVASNH